MSMCLDEGMLQAYMDGELAPAQRETCAAHLATCAICAELAHEAEHEYALCATAFAPVLSVPAPTARLRVRLEDALAGLQAPPRRIVASPVSRLRAWAAIFAASFAFKPRYAGAFASFLVAVALTVTLTMIRPKQPEQIAGNKEANLPGAPNADAGAPPLPKSASEKEIKRSTNESTGAPAAKRKPFVNANYKQPAIHQPSAPDEVTAQLAPLLPDEKKYMTTIATLDAAIKAQGQGALPPSLRAEYERNLALVDQAIISTRVAARRNPQDANVKEFLRAAYQNKVDLLTTVADQTQLIAARD